MKKYSLLVEIINEINCTTPTTMCRIQLTHSLTQTVLFFMQQYLLHSNWKFHGFCYKTKYRTILQNIHSKLNLKYFRWCIYRGTTVSLNNWLIFRLKMYYIGLRTQSIRKYLNSKVQRIRMWKTSYQRPNNWSKTTPV